MRWPWCLNSSVKASRLYSAEKLLMVLISRPSFEQRSLQFEISIIETRYLSLKAVSLFRTSSLICFEYFDGFSYTILPTILPRRHSQGMVKKVKNIKEA
jgi:hypothetical protein